MIKILKFLRNVAYVNILTIQMIFFSFYAILGLTYGGSTESNSYKYVLIISSLICYFFLFYDIIVLRYIRRKGLFFLLMPFGVLFIYFINGTYTDFTIQILSLFILLVVPSMFVGYILAVTDNIKLIINGFYYVSIIIAFGILNSFNDLINTNVIDLMTVYGGGQYQALSYFSAFGFSSVLFKFLFFRKKKWYNYLLNIFILLVLLFGVILSGGRGGAIVVILITLIFMYVKYGFRKLIFKIGILATFLFLILIYFNDYVYFERVMQGVSRLFSYISDNGLDLSQSSNRDVFYNTALLNIKESLIFGYGLFSYAQKTGEFYSHNIFLDILLHGGVIYLLIWLIVFFLFFYKIKLILKKNIDQIFILIPTISSFVLLSFSGTYLEESMFWVSLSYVFTYKFKSHSILIS